VLFDLIVGIFCAGRFVPVAGEDRVVNEVWEHSSVERMCRVIMIKLGKFHLFPTIRTHRKRPLDLKIIPLNLSRNQIHSRIKCILHIDISITVPLPINKINNLIILIQLSYH
jgi:hypothetical protein